MSAFPTGRATMAPALSSATNYYDWTWSWIAPYLNEGRILDIGSGTAGHLQNLAGKELVSIDLDADVVAELSAQYAETNPSWSFRVQDITDPSTPEKMGADQFDVAMSCNVFEHIENDSAAFINTFKMLKPGGRIVLLLPAHQTLFGSVDQLAGHHRRYDKLLLQERLANAGFDIDVIRYVNVVGALAWFINSRLIRHKEITSGSIAAQINVFDKYLVPLLQRLEGDRDMPFGQSVLAVARKPLT